MEGILKVKSCGDACHARDAATQGMISKRVVELGDWPGEETGSFNATAWGSTAETDLCAGDIILASLILRSHEGMNLITLAGFTKIGHEEGTTD